jgi:hypothetical protein
LPADVRRKILNPIANWLALDWIRKALSLAAVFAIAGGIAGGIFFLSTGGSGSSSEQAAARPTRTASIPLPDACVLITTEDAQRVFGKTFFETSSQPTENTRNCFYRGVTGARGANDPSYGCPSGLGIDVWSDGALDPAKTEAISGLGDEAYWSVKVGTPSIWARHGDIRFSIGLSYESVCDDETPDALASKARSNIEMLAQNAISRLLSPEPTITLQPTS